MTDTIILYLVVWVAMILAVLAIAIKLEKMVRVIVWNYILWFLCFFTVVSLYTLWNNIGWDAWFGKFLIESRYFVAFLLYMLWRFFAYHNFSVKIKWHWDLVMENISYLLYVPLTVIGTILTVMVIIVWPMVRSWSTLATAAADITNNLYLQQAIIYLPELFVAYTIVTFLAFCDFKLKWGGGWSPTITW